MTLSFKQTLAAVLHSRKPAEAPASQTPVAKDTISHGLDLSMALRQQLHLSRLHNANR